MKTKASCLVLLAFTLVALIVNTPGYAASKPEGADPSSISVVGDWQPAEGALVSKPDETGLRRILPLLFLDQDGKLIFSRFVVQGTSAKMEELPAVDGSCNGGQCAAAGVALSCPASGGPTCSAGQTCSCTCDAGGGSTSTHNACS